MAGVDREFPLASDGYLLGRGCEPLVCEYEEGITCQADECSEHATHRYWFAYDHEHGYLCRYHATLWVRGLIAWDGRMFR